MRRQEVKQALLGAAIKGFAIGMVLILWKGWGAW